MSINKNNPLLKVFIMDLLCIIPFYDRYLCEHLQTINPTTRLGSISFHLDLNFFERFKIQRQNGLLDLVAKLRTSNIIIRRVLKVIEYILNLILLTIRFSFSKPNIVHIQWLPLITHLPFEKLFIKVLKKYGVKLVYTVHNVLPHDTGIKFKNKFNHVYQLVDILICHTQQAKDELVNDFHIAKEKIWVIPHGPMFHDVSFISPNDARAELCYEDNQTIVLFFGTIRPYKGLEFLLEAWQHVIAVCPNSRLIIAGTGDKGYLDEIRGHVNRLNLEHAVEMHFKFISNEELPLFHAAADVLVYPYQNITQSGALLTGMAFGKAIVATCSGGFKETLHNGETGILVQYNNVQELSDSLIELINNSEKRNSLGRAALEHLNSVYSWTAIAEQTLACYRATFQSRNEVKF